MIFANWNEIIVYRGFIINTKSNSTEEKIFAIVDQYLFRRPLEETLIDFSLFLLVNSLKSNFGIILKSISANSIYEYIKIILFSTIEYYPIIFIKIVTIRNNHKNEKLMIANRRICSRKGYQITYNILCEYFLKEYEKKLPIKKIKQIISEII